MDLQFCMSRVRRVEGFLTLDLPTGDTRGLRATSGEPIAKFKTAQPGAVLWLGDRLGLLLYWRRSTWAPGQFVLHDGRLLSPSSANTESAPDVTEALAHGQAVVRAVLLRLMQHWGSDGRDADVTLLLGQSAGVQQALTGLAGAETFAFRAAAAWPEVAPIDPPSEQDRQLIAAASQAWTIDWETALLAATGSGRLELPALNGSAETVRAFVCLLNSGKSKGAAIICLDDAARTSHIIFALTQYTAPSPVAVYFPAAKLMVGKVAKPDQEGMLGRFLMPMIKIFLDAGDDLPLWLSSDRHEAAFCLTDWRNMHVGHFLWQECYMIRMAAKESPGLPPMLYSLPGGGGDLFGPVDVIFPEYGGRVSRELPDRAAVTVDAIRKRRLLLPHFGKGFVWNDMWTRLARAVDADPATAIHRDFARLLRIDSGVPVVVLGLRLQNRCIHQSQEFYQALVRRICQRFGRVVFVVDGLNHVPNGSESGLPILWTAKGQTETVIADEVDFVDQLRAASEGLPATIVSCIGTTLTSNLFWMSLACYFVSPYGGGLAKTRWALNLPGYAIASHVNLTDFKYLDLYHGSTYMEDPSPLSFNEARHTVDTPEEGVHGGYLVPGFVPSSVNFSIEWEPSIQAILVGIGTAIADLRENGGARNSLLKGPPALAAEPATERLQPQ